MELVEIKTIQKIILFFKNQSRITKSIFLVLFASLLLALSGQFKVPLGPVPITLQTLVVMLIGAFYGWKLGAVTIVAYWIEGIVIGGLISSMPWFTNGSGLVYFLGSPSAGFLWGFLPMVIVTGFLVKAIQYPSEKKSIIQVCFFTIFLFLSIIIGQIFLYGTGLTQAYLLILPNVDWMNSFDDLLRIYVLPFLVGDFLKSLIATIIIFLATAKQREKIR
jgi:biotin transport system substrate-specific component